MHTRTKCYATGISPIRRLVPPKGARRTRVAGPQRPLLQTGPEGGAAAELWASVHPLTARSVASICTGQPVLLNGAAPTCTVISIARGGTYLVAVLQIHERLLQINGVGPGCVGEHLSLASVFTLAGRW